MAFNKVWIFFLISSLEPIAQVMLGWLRRKFYPAFQVFELKHKAVVKAFHKTCLKTGGGMSKATLVDRRKQGIPSAFKYNL